MLFLLLSEQKNSAPFFSFMGILITKPTTGVGCFLFFCQSEEPTVFTVVVAVVRVKNKPLWFFIRIENQLFREGLFVLGLSVC